MISCLLVCGVGVLKPWKGVKGAWERVEFPERCPGLGRGWMPGKGFMGSPEKWLEVSESKGLGGS